MCTLLWECSIIVISNFLNLTFFYLKMRYRYSIREHVVLYLGKIIVVVIFANVNIFIAYNFQQKDHHKQVWWKNNLMRCTILSK